MVQSRSLSDRVTSFSSTRTSVPSQRSPGLGTQLSVGPPSSSRQAPHGTLFSSTWAGLGAAPPAARGTLSSGRLHQAPRGSPREATTLPDGAGSGLLLTGLVTQAGSWWPRVRPEEETQNRPRPFCGEGTALRLAGPHQGMGTGGRWLQPLRAHGSGSLTKTQDGEPWPPLQGTLRWERPGPVPLEPKGGAHLPLNSALGTKPGSDTQAAQGSEWGEPRPGGQGRPRRGGSRLPHGHA